MSESVLLLSEPDSQPEGLQPAGLHPKFLPSGGAAPSRPAEESRPDVAGEGGDGTSEARSERSVGASDRPPQEGASQQAGGRQCPRTACEHGQFLSGVGRLIHRRAAYSTLQVGKLGHRQMCSFRNQPRAGALCAIEQFPL